MRTITSALVLAAALASAAPISAQSAAPQPGQRVWLVFAQRQQLQGQMSRQIKGTLVAADADSLTVQVDSGAPVRVARGAVRNTYVSLGVPSRGKSAAWGAAGGVGAGVVYGMTSMKDERRSDAENALIGAVGGAIGGAVAGALFPREGWELIRAPRNVTISPTLSPDAQALVVNVRL
jgi:hypothetical protein